MYVYKYNSTVCRRSLFKLLNFFGRFQKFATPWILSVGGGGEGVLQGWGEEYKWGYYPGSL